MSKTLSIITVNRNNVIGLQKTMNSVYEQTNHDYEWIVIDGGSTDGSKELLQKNRDRINYWISEPDKGIYDGMNKGIVQAHGDYLLFLNSGDCFANESVLDSFFAHHNQADFIVGCFAKEGDRQQENAKQATFSPEEEVFFLCIGAYPHQATFIRRRVFEQYGLYREDKKIASDWYLAINALFKGNATVSHLPILVSVCEKDGISTRFRQELYQERIDLIRENAFFSVLFEFYAGNREIVTALRKNRFVFFLFRVYFYFYRKVRIRDSR